MVRRAPGWSWLAVLAGVLLAVYAHAGHLLPGDAAGARLQAHLPVLLVRLVALASSETALAVLVVVLAWALRRSLRPLPFLATMGLVPLLERITKAIVHRARPRMIEEGWGFPSGHAWITMALAVLLVEALWRQRDRGARLRLVLMIGAAVAVIGVDRVALGAHWPSDVLGGWLFGLAYGAWIGPWTLQKSTTERRPDADAARDVADATQG